MNFQDLIESRRSVRKFSGAPVTGDQLQTILRAGLLAPTGHNYRPVRLKGIQDKSLFPALSSVRTGGAAFLPGAEAVILVMADVSQGDTWVEDCSVSAAQMLLMITELGLGACWIQCRNRKTAEEVETEAAVRAIVPFPEDYRLLCMIALGVPAAGPEKKVLTEEDLSHILS